MRESIPREHHLYTLNSESNSSLLSRSSSISGLAKMHNLTSVKARPVRFKAGLWNGTEYTLQLDTFQVLDSSTNFTLKLDNFNASVSSAGIDQQLCKNNFKFNKNQKFSTKERDNDLISTQNCAEKLGGGGFWYNKCTHVSPNSEYCPSSSCGSYKKLIKLKCLMGDSYSMKKFQIDVLVE